MMWPGRNCEDGGVHEIRIGPAVGRAARRGSLTLLVAGEPTIAPASIGVALQTIPILASCDRGLRKLRRWSQTWRGQERGYAFFSPTLKCPT